MRFALALLALTSGIVAGNSNCRYLLLRLPSLMKCIGHRNYPQECVASSLKSLKKYIRDGIPEIDIPSFNPYLFLENYIITKAEDRGAILYTDISIYYLQHFLVKDVRLPTNRWEWMTIRLHFPYLRAVASTSLDFVSTDTNVTVDIWNVMADVDIRGTFYIDPLDNERYFQVDSVPVKLTIGGLVLRLVGRDSGDPLLKALNQFLYKHREAMKIEMLSSMSTHAGILIGRLANIIYSACPFKYLAQI